ncbi:cytochrome c family protein [Rhizobiaceae bacterium n13]|uniref:Cytochrome c family protein n=1 Tax=Ferirhizobium litorale TaxID=2927786 RepID=A0AAE3U2G3_9HYPH|nr:cytochrome c family protein [Fererhizobium litorale]MDI7860821.1 cytochrome c family protein [Fererhizobium litorale]MDI7920969.1 cytochrome c family protein [Fererhizobium litorale]
MKVHCLMIVGALLSSAGLAYAEGDAAAGATVFKKCTACHTATEPKNKVGPSLMGIVGRPVATVEGFNYSPAMKKFGEGKVWDDALLEEYLPNPKVLVKGTKMAFAGVKNPEDVINLVAYLKDPAAAQ